MLRGNEHHVRMGSFGCRLGIGGNGEKKQNLYKSKQSGHAENHAFEFYCVISWICIKFQALYGNADSTPKQCSLLHLVVHLAGCREVWPWPSFSHLHSRCRLWSQRPVSILICEVPIHFSLALPKRQGSPFLTSNSLGCLKLIKS